MTSNELLDLLDFEEGLDNVSIIKQLEMNYGATFIVAELFYNNLSLTVPFVYYQGADWIFTPFDWQGQLPYNPEDIDTIKWRVNNTETEAVITDGVPMLTPWTPDVKNISRETRKRIGSTLKSTREKRHISMRSLASETGISANTICRIENGRLNVSLDTVSIIANALCLSIELKEKQNIATGFTDRNGKAINGGDTVRIDDEYDNIHCVGTIVFISQDPSWNPYGGEWRIRKTDGTIVDTDIYTLCLSESIEVIDACSKTTN